MKKFEVGHTYFDQYACDHETLSTIKIVKRTAKTVTFERHGKTRRAKLYEDCNGEYIIPDHYSMACVYRAERELLDEEPEQEVITDYAVSENLLVLTAGGEDHRASLWQQQLPKEGAGLPDRPCRSGHQRHQLNKAPVNRNLRHRGFSFYFFSLTAVPNE